MMRILIGHPSRLVCDSLRTALDKVDNVYVVGCATKAEELHFLLPHGNIVLMSTELEDASALDTVSEIRMLYSDTKVLVLGLADSPDLILRYIEAGAAGYILQDESVVEMVDKLRASHEGKAIISPFIASALMVRLAHLANLDTSLAYLEARETQLNELTSREEEVLSLINEGLTNQEIAERLYIECGTVKNHVHKVLKKLEVKSRQEATYVLQSNQRPDKAGFARF